MMTAVFRFVSLSGGEARVRLLAGSDTAAEVRARGKSCLMCRPMRGSKF